MPRFASARRTCSSGSATTTHISSHSVAVEPASNSFTASSKTIGRRIPLDLIVHRLNTAGCTICSRRPNLCASLKTICGQLACGQYARRQPGLLAKSVHDGVKCCFTWFHHLVRHLVGVDHVGALAMQVCGNRTFAGGDVAGQTDYQGIRWFPVVHLLPLLSPRHTLPHSRLAGTQKTTRRTVRRAISSNSYAQPSVQLSTPRRPSHASAHPMTETGYSRREAASILLLR